MKTSQEIREEQAQLQARINVLNVEYREAKLRESGLSVGDIVIQKGKRYQVTRHDGWAPLGNPIKKDGTPSVLERGLYDYVKETK